MRVPAALRGRILPPVTPEEVLKHAAYREAVDPTPQDVTREQFDQVVYDVAAANASMDRAAVVAWVKKRYRVVKGERGRNGK